MKPFCGKRAKTLDDSDELPKDLFDILEDTTKTINDLKAENKKLRECAEFYADKQNWSMEMHVRGDDYEVQEKGTKIEWIAGGKRARQCLKGLSE